MWLRGETNSQMPSFAETLSNSWGEGDRGPVWRNNTSHNKVHNTLNKVTCITGIRSGSHGLGAYPPGHWAIRTRLKLECSHWTTWHSPTNPIFSDRCGAFTHHVWPGGSNPDPRRGPQMTTCPPSLTHRLWCLGLIHRHRQNPFATKWQRCSVELTQQLDKMLILQEGFMTKRSTFLPFSVWDLKRNKDERF